MKQAICNPAILLVFAKCSRTEKLSNFGWHIYIRCNLWKRQIHNEQYWITASRPSLCLVQGISSCDLYFNDLVAGGGVCCLTLTYHSQPHWPPHSVSEDVHANLLGERFSN